MLTGGIVPFQRFASSVSTAWNTFWDIWTTSRQPVGAFRPQINNYDMWWAYYNNTIFEDPAMWTGLYQRAGMYRHMRPVYNPCRRIVDFYAGAVYPGALSEDGEDLPEGVPLAIPLAYDTPPPLKKAIAQIWQWANMQTLKSQMVRWPAALGEAMIEVVDDVVKGRVYFNLIWPGQIVELQRDSMGNVKSYAMEYQATDEAGHGYTYRKEVDNVSFRTYKDEEPYSYDDVPAEIENPYGFVPAAWTMHRDIGGPHGAPALDGTFNKIARMMALGSHIHDQVHKAIGAPVVLWTDGEFKTRSLSPLSGGAVSTKRADQSSLVLDPESVLMLKGPQGGNAQSLLGGLQLQDALSVLSSLQLEIAADQPVLKMYDELRGMSQVTGPAASRLIGDAASYVYETSNLADQQMVSLHRMAVAIAGWRLKEGMQGWADPTEQQKKFSGFDLTSYERGNLDFTIMPRPLIPITHLERATTAVQVYTAALNGVNAGIPVDLIMKKMGWSDADLAQIKAHQDQLKADEQAKAQADIQGKLDLAKASAEAAAKNRPPPAPAQGNTGQGTTGQASQTDSPVSTGTPGTANRGKTPAAGKSSTQK